MENQFDKALKEADNLRKLLSKDTKPTVRNSDETSTVKAVSYAWFKNHRPALQSSSPILEELDGLYNNLLNYSDKQTSRNVYANTLKNIRKNLMSCRGDQLTATQTVTSDAPPDFSSVIPDPKMQVILVNRWEECDLCLRGGASLAATVMMGGLLEALLLAKINCVDDKTAIFQSPSAPINSVSGKTKQLKEWGLKDYISVAHDLQWISVSAKDVGEVLRDYRNFIHPFKQLSHGIHLTPADAKLFWEISKEIARQLV